MKTPILNEDAISQLPALHLLQNLGWQYLKPDEALDLRDGKLSNVLLEGVLVPWLREHNRVRFKGKELPFTDRVDLDDQIYRTFHHCGKEVEQARTGKHLSELLKGSKQRIVTTIIDKFEAAVGRHVVRNDDPNIFVLVDEGHRGQYGLRHAKMRWVLPNACYIGFTGTSVMKKDKNTVEKFGGLIDSYTIDRAVADKAVVPLLYEGRHVEQHVDSLGVDAWFERIMANLSKEQAVDLKKTFFTTDQLNKAAQKVMAIAWDVTVYANVS